jgi:membrane-associated protease RseP (regulator of RpoE activity)
MPHGLRYILVTLLLLGIGASQTREKRVAPVDSGLRQTFEKQLKIALVVGVGNYGASTGLSTLKYPARDVEALAAELEKQGYLVRRLVDGDATRGAVRRTLNELTAALDPNQGTFLFYFSGHGFQQEGINYLATFGSSADDLKSEGLAVTEVQTLLRSGRARQSMMFIDACRNDPAAGTRQAGVRTFATLEAAQGLRVLYSTRSGRVSYESDELKQGVFTHYLVRGLRGEAAGADGLVTFRDLADYVTDQARAYGVRLGQVQVPYEAGESSGDFLLARIERPGAVADSTPHGAIGIAFPGTDDANLLKAYGASQGVFVQSLTSGAPAAKAGMKEEDIITAINDKSIMKSQELTDEVAKAAIGQTLRLTILRNRKVVTLSVVVGDRNKIYPPEQTAKADTKKSASDAEMDDLFKKFFGTPAPALPPSPTRARFGITVKPIAEVTPKSDYTGAGIAVVWVGAKTLGSDLGIQRQDIIQSINGQSVATVQDVDNAVKALKEEDSVAIKVARRDESGSWGTEYVTGAIPKAPAQ